MRQSLQAPALVIEDAATPQRRYAARADASGRTSRDKGTRAPDSNSTDAFTRKSSPSTHRSPHLRGQNGLRTYHRLPHAAKAPPPPAKLSSSATPQPSPTTNTYLVRRTGAARKAKRKLLLGPLDPNFRKGPQPGRRRCGCTERGSPVQGQASHPRLQKGTRHGPPRPLRCPPHAKARSQLLRALRVDGRRLPQGRTRQDLGPG